MSDAFSLALALFAQASATAEASAAAEQQTGMSGWLVLLLVVALLVLPFAIGSLLARALRMKADATRFGVVLFVLTLGVAPFVAKGQDAFKLGIDLAGGTNLVYQVLFDKAKEQGKDVPDADRPRVMEQMVAAVKRRLDPANQKEITVRQVGSDQIEVIIPGADPATVAESKAAITRLGSLEFGILANRVDHLPEIQQAESEPGLSEVTMGGRVVARWVPIAIDAQGQPKIDPRGDIAIRDAIDPDTGRPKLTEKGIPIREVLVIQDTPEERVTGQFLKRAQAAFDESGRPAVTFEFNQAGGIRFQALTHKYRPTDDGRTRQLAILLDGQVHSAPNLQAVITTHGQITGRFTREEVNELVNVLNAGALEVPIQETPIYEFTIGPTLAHDVQEKGVMAIVIAGLAVVVFMIGYYLFAGVVAALCLLFNLLLVMGAMALIDAAYTLPGLAGIVLTIGMAVDANVLIFERIREEQQRGSSLRMAIHNGFGRAMSAIIDGNVTTLITAIVLYLIGTDQIRGFAVTLFIGLVASLFTAIYFGRLVFDVIERKRLLKKISMLSIVGRTNFDFLSKKWLAIGSTSLVIVAGLGAFAVRGSDNFDVDFNGGTMVTFEFVEPQDRAGQDRVRAALQAEVERLGTGITLEPLQTIEERDQGKNPTRFRLRTLQSDVSVVRAAINDAFQSSGLTLRKVTLDSYGPIEPIPQNPPADGPVIPREFRGGHRVPLLLSGELPTSTLRAQIEAQLQALQVDNRPKYENLQTLFTVRGTKGSGVTAAATEMQRFDGMELLAAPRFAVEDIERVLAGAQAEMAGSPVFEEINTFEPAVAKDMQQTAVMAMLASIGAIAVYIWFRFQRLSFGIAAIVALVHDVLVTLGLLALASMISDTEIGRLLLLEDFRINLPMVAAFLTLVGYSLNDTIVIFDRIREVRGKNPSLTPEMVNLSINQTLARTILTSLTTLIVVVILYAVGGEGIHGFAFCLVVGVIVGTFSTIYIANPVLLWLMNRPGAETARGAAASRTTPAAVR